MRGVLRRTASGHNHEVVDTLRRLLRPPRGVFNAPFRLLWRSLRDPGYEWRTGQFRVFAIFAIALGATIVEGLRGGIAHVAVAVVMALLAVGTCVYAKWLLDSGEDV